MLLSRKGAKNMFDVTVIGKIVVRLFLGSILCTVK